MPKKVLFVCTGNVFRSFTAEVCFNNAVRKKELKGESAGTQAQPEPINPVILDELKKLGVTVSKHKQRRLDIGLLEEADLVVAMSVDHKRFIEDNFKHEAVLFKKICYGKDEPLLDVHEAVENHNERRDLAEQYEREVVDFIYNSMPLFLKNVNKYLNDKV